MNELLVYGEKKNIFKGYVLYLYKMKQMYSRPTASVLRKVKARVLSEIDGEFGNQIDGC